jgi:hypothetical protein
VILFALIAGGLYWLAGAWGAVLLWVLLLIFVVLPFLPAVVMLFLHGRENLAAGRRTTGVASVGGSMLAGMGWAAAAAYCLYRAYLAVP